MPVPFRTVVPIDRFLKPQTWESSHLENSPLFSTFQGIASLNPLRFNQVDSIPVSIRVLALLASILSEYELDAFLENLNVED